MFSIDLMYEFLCEFPRRGIQSLFSLSYLWRRSSYAMEECLSSSCKGNIGPTQWNLRGQFRLSEQQLQESQSCRIAVIRWEGRRRSPSSGWFKKQVERVDKKREEGVTCFILHFFQVLYFSTTHTLVPVASGSFENEFKVFFKNGFSRIN